MDARISIIVPVYNVEGSLHRCIDSILAQTFTDFELLLIDDGSKDNSGKICDEYVAKDLRVRVFHKENGGVSSARNLGLDNAKGEWVTFVDSDDYVLPYFLETFCTMSKDGDVCIQGIIPDYSISSEYQVYKSSFDYIGNVKGALFMLNDCQMVGSLCNKMFRSSIIHDKNLRLKEALKLWEDEEFFLHYLQYAQKVVATTYGYYVYFVPDFSKYYNTNNLQTLILIFRAVSKIFKGGANIVTDSYQIKLYNEWISLLRSNSKQSIKLLPKILCTVGWRIIRVKPLKAVFEKVLCFIKKNQ